MSFNNFEDGNKIERFTIEVSANQFNEHVTNIVAIKHRMFLNKTNMNPEDYKTTLDLLDKVYAVDKRIHEEITRQHENRHKS